MASDPIAMPVFADGFRRGGGRIPCSASARRPDPGKHDYTMAEARALIDAVHVGIEIASSPFPGINRHGPAVTVSDFGNNNGLIVGIEADGWREGDINAWPITLSIDGEVVGSARAATMLDGPFGAARFLFEHLARRTIAVPVGTWSFQRRGDRRPSGRGGRAGRGEVRRAVDDRMRHHGAVSRHQ